MAEGLALDQALLVRTVFPHLSPQALKNMDAACQLGILKRMAGIGAALLKELGSNGIAQCQAHASDTVRGWACFMIGARPELDLPSRLTAIRPLADDAHFGVREWAWMAVRPHLAQELDAAITLIPEIAVIERRIDAAIRERFGLPAEMSSAVAAADIRALAGEARQLFRGQSWDAMATAGRIRLVDSCCALASECHREAERVFYICFECLFRGDCLPTQLPVEAQKGRRQSSRLESR